MNLHRALRLLAGTVILISIALTLTVNKHFVWLTAFVGLNLLQSSFTNWCPAMWMLEKAGLQKEAPVEGESCCS